MREILSDAAPAVGVHVAAELDEEAQIEVIVYMTAGEWRSLNADGWQR